MRIAVSKVMFAEVLRQAEKRIAIRIKRVRTKTVGQSSQTYYTKT